MELLIPALHTLIAFQCFFFLAFLAVTGKFKLEANRLLGCLLATLGSHMALNLINQHLFVGALPNIAIGLGYLYGPILYFYANSLAFQTFKLQRIHLIHCLPAIGAITLELAIHIDAIVYAVGIFASLTSYIIYAWINLKKYREMLAQVRSEYDDIALHWLSNLLLIQLALLILNATSVAFYSSGNWGLGYLFEIGLFLCLLILISFIIFKGLQHPMLFEGMSEEDQKLSRPEADRISPKEAGLIMASIETSMMEALPYKNPNLTLNTLAKKLSLPARQVSQAINIQSGKNFSEYVNTHRIKYACDMLAAPEHKHLSILDIMFEAGFNTKSNFNRSFKVETGITPFQYRRQMQEKSTKS